jgi:hypothetical protein
VLGTTAELLEGNRRPLGLPISDLLFFKKKISSIMGTLSAPPGALFALDA